jgi:predicted nucleic acid-binding protein
VIRTAPTSGVLWDTMFASKLRLGRRDILEAAVAQRGTAYEPLLAAPVVSEVVFGFRRSSGGARDAAWWEGNVLAGAQRLRYVSPSLEAVVLAARVRARQPASPAKARRTEGRKDPERRVSWSRDIALAAIAATSGLPLATENLRDFTAIAALIRQVAPGLTLDLRESVFS